MEDNNKTFTQDEVNNLIKERLDRAEKKYSGYLSPEDVEVKHQSLRDQIAALTAALDESKGKAEADAKSITELQSKITKFETDAMKIRIATEVGLPAELASRLNGTTEEEFKSDAEKLKTMFGSSYSIPMRNPEAGGMDGDEKTQVLKEVLGNLRKR